MANPSASPSSVCQACLEYRPANDFNRNHLGDTYSTCRSCREAASRRTPLADLDPNAPRETRGTLSRRAQRARNQLLRPASEVSDLQENPRLPKRTRTRAVVRLSRAERVVQRQQDRIHRPMGFISMLDPAQGCLDLGFMTQTCDNCSARYWIHECSSPNEYNKCCKGGEAELPVLQSVPPFLKHLLTDRDDPIAVRFRVSIRAYNSAFAFTSASYRPDTRIDRSRGVNCFQIHGEMFHYQGPLQDDTPSQAAFAQVYFYDPAYATNLRSARYPDLDCAILSRLLEELTECNPFIGLYKTARERLVQQAPDARIILNPQMRLVMQSGADRRRENLPTAEEVAVILPDEWDKAGRRDIVMALRTPVQGRGLEIIAVTHAAYMPLHYVLLFPRGDYGWHYGLTLRNGGRLEQRVFYRHRLHVRLELSPLFSGCRLFQQFVVDAFAACETTALDWLRRNQSSIRSDVYQGLADALVRDDMAPTDVGRRIVLPSSYVGSDRYMQQLFQDSMAIVRHFGRPTFFITFTANPAWEEIKRELRHGQAATDRPDLIARVFHMKVKALLAELKAALFGPYAGHVYTIEYQKRGLPHMHLLFFIDSSAKFDTPARVDEVVCAELPDLSCDPTGELKELVKKHMIHGPCGEHNPSAPCMVEKVPGGPKTCQKRFPKEYSSETLLHEDGYPQYRRRNDGRTFTVRKPGAPTTKIVLDNRWVVPYNPYLLKTYLSHINVEVCATVQAVKYIHKYVYKGSDRTTISVAATNDEISRYLQGRYIGPIEAVWRIFEFSTHQEYPPVYHLAVHLPGNQPVYFRDDAEPGELLERAENAHSTLMGFFDYNKNNDDGRHLLYPEFPRRYVWERKSRKWLYRQRGVDKCIGRMYHCSPITGERYYLRLLLTTVRGPRSFEDIRTVQGICHPTFQAACIALGLAENDQEWFQCFDEAVIFSSGRSLRTLFLTGLLQRLIAEPLAIWEKYKIHFCDDLLHKIRDASMNYPLVMLSPEYDYGLFLLGLAFKDRQQSLSDYSLPENTFDWTRCHEGAARRDAIAQDTLAAADLRRKLNADQLVCFDTIVSAIDTDPKHAHFYLQGPGGTGKTFLYRAICCHFRSLEKKVLCVASTGIAALLLPEGRTSHSTFKIPLHLNESSVSSLKKNGMAADILRQTDLIIWDEVPMQHKYCFEVVHRLLTDLQGTDDDVLFGGVPLVMGGDFAQILPVVPQGSRADIVSACLQRSFVWNKLRQLRLRTNMRVRNTPLDQDFARWIASLPYDMTLNGQVALLPSITVVRSTLDLLDSIYPPTILNGAVRNQNALHGRAVLSPLNAGVAELNNLVFDRFPGQERVYNAKNSADINEADGLDIEELPAEYLQSIDLSSLPVSMLRLKVGVPVMLLRNLCPREGLCNGTRMVVTSLRLYSVECRILGGDFDGQLRVIPRINLSSTEDKLSFVLTRKQFPIRLSFAISINKSQGQSLDIVGIDLRTPVFTHGQFYVAVSRVTAVSGLQVLLPEMAEEEGSKTANIVFPEVLDGLKP